MPESWRGSFFDGQTAARQEVEVSLEADGVHLRRQDGSVLVWPYWLIRASFEGETSRLETKTAIVQSMWVADAGFGQALRRTVPALGNGGGADDHTLWKIGAIGAVCLLALGVGLWAALPYAGSAVVSAVPRAWEEKLGAMVADSLAPASKRCKDPEVQGALEQILHELERGTPSPYKFRLHVVNDSTVNAFAAPGGHIAIHRGLIERTKSPEEAAGVLAHEMQHVLLRHGTKAMLRGLGIRLLFAALLGDAGALASLTGSLGEMHFQRQDEVNADREGLRTMERAQLNPQGMVDLLQTLEKQAADAPGVIAYFSTHPQTKDRIEDMKRMADAMDYRPKALLPGVAWPPDMGDCGK